MLFRYDNLKRAAVLLGIVLAVSSSVQQTSLLCHLAGCAMDSGASLGGWQADCLASSCSCSHQTAQTAELAGLPDGRVMGEDSSCPCPLSCWCHQGPVPMKLPKGTSTSSLLVVLGIDSWYATSVEIAEDHQLSRVTSTAALESTALPASQRCVQLCRFQT